MDDCVNRSPDLAVKRLLGIKHKWPLQSTAKSSSQYVYVIQYITVSVCEVKTLLASPSVTFYLIVDTQTPSLDYISLEFSYKPLFVVIKCSDVYFLNVTPVRIG